MNAPLTIYPNVSCSQCGKDFGPGPHGFSDCRSHAPYKPFHPQFTHFLQIASEIRAARADLNGAIDNLDDRQCVDNFLRDWNDTIPEALIAESYGDDRIKKSPQYRALSPDARIAADWAFAPKYCSTEPLAPGHVYIDTPALIEARDFFTRVASCCRDDDEADEIAQNAHDNLRGVIHNRDEEAALERSFEPERRREFIYRYG